MKLFVPTANVTGATPLQMLSHEDPAQCPSAQAAGYNPHGMFSDCGFVRSQAMRFLQSKGTEYQVP